MANPTRPSTSTPDTVDPFAKDAADQAQAKAVAAAQAAQAAHKASAIQPHEQGLLDGLKGYISHALGTDRPGTSATGNPGEDKAIQVVDGGLKDAPQQGHYGGN